jgi:hypothetical protein
LFRDESLVDTIAQACGFVPEELARVIRGYAGSGVDSLDGVSGGFDGDAERASVQLDSLFALVTDNPGSPDAEGAWVSDFSRIRRASRTIRSQGSVRRFICVPGMRLGTKSSQPSGRGISRRHRSASGPR